MLNADAVDFFFLYTFLWTFLQLRRTVRGKESLPPDLHRRRLSLLQVPFYPRSLQNWARGQRIELDVVIGVAKIKQQTIVPTLIPRRLNYVVNCGFLISAGEHL
jgi:hypothetical protein